MIFVILYLQCVYLLCQVMQWKVVSMAYQNQNETKKKQKCQIPRKGNNTVQYRIFKENIYIFTNEVYIDKNSYSSAQTTKRRRRYKATIITVSSNIQKVIFIFTFMISANSFHRRRLCSVIDVDVDSEEGGIELERPET